MKFANWLKTRQKGAEGTNACACDELQNSQTMPSHQPVRSQFYENALVMLCNPCEPAPNAVAACHEPFYRMYC